MKLNTYTLIQLDDTFRLVDTLHKEYKGYSKRYNKFINKSTTNETYTKLEYLYKNFYTTIQPKNIALDIDYKTLLALNVVDKETGKVNIEYLVNDKKTNTLSQYLKKHELNEIRFNKLDIITILLYIFTKHYNAIKTLFENDEYTKKLNSINAYIEDYKKKQKERYKKENGENISNKEWDIKMVFHNQTNTTTKAKSGIDLEKFDLYNEYIGPDDETKNYNFAPYDETKIDENSITNINTLEKSHIFLLYNKIMKTAKIVTVGRGFLDQITEKIEPLYLELDYNSDIMIYKHVKIVDTRFEEFRDYIESEEDLTEEAIQDIIHEFQGNIVINSTTIKRSIQTIFDISNDMYDAIKFTNILNTLTDSFGIKKNGNEQDKQNYKTLKMMLPYVMVDLGLNKKRMNDGMYWYGLKKKFEGKTPSVLLEKIVNPDITSSEFCGNRTNRLELFKNIVEKQKSFIDSVGDTFEYENVLNKTFESESESENDAFKFIQSQDVSNKRTFYENVLHRIPEVSMNNKKNNQDEMTVSLYNSPLYIQTDVSSNIDVGEIKDIKSTLELINRLMGRDTREEMNTIVNLIFSNPNFADIIKNVKKNTLERTNDTIEIERIVYTIKNTLGEDGSSITKEHINLVLENDALMKCIYDTVEYYEIQRLNEKNKEKDEKNETLQHLIQGMEEYNGVIEKLYMDDSKMKKPQTDEVQGFTSSFYDINNYGKTNDMTNTNIDSDTFMPFENAYMGNNAEIVSPEDTGLQELQREKENEYKKYESFMYDRYKIINQLPCYKKNSIASIIIDFVDYQLYIRTKKIHYDSNKQLAIQYIMEKIEEMNKNKN